MPVGVFVYEIGLPEVGMRPICASLKDVNHSAPSEPTVMPSGPLETGYSVIVVTHPLVAHWPLALQHPFGHEVDVHTQAPALLQTGVAAVHAEHVALDVPQAAFSAAPTPAEHVPKVAPAGIEQQPPLHVPVQVTPHAPETHAWFAGH